MNPSTQLSLMKTLGYPGTTQPKTYAQSGYSLRTPSPQLPQPAAVDPYGYQKQQLAQGQALLDEIRRLSAPKPFTYSTFNIAANSAKARSAAENAVNPLYTKKLQQYLDQQRTLQQRQESDTATAQKDLDEALQNTLQANELTRARTAEDTASSIANINTQAEQYQADTGENFDRARLALLRSGGDVGVGLGAQTVAQQQRQRNTEEGRQVQNFSEAKRTQDLIKTRTFEDIAKSGDLATQSTGKKKEALQLSLSRYIQDQGVGAGASLADIIAGSGTNIKTQADAYEAQRLADVLSQTGQYESAGYKQFLSTLKGQNLANTAQVYGGLF